MLIEEVYVKALGTAIKILILEETSEEWQKKRAFYNVLGSTDDVAIKVYSTLLEEGKKLDTRSLATLVNKSQFMINRALKNLMQLGLVDYESKRRGPYELKWWYAKKHILGLMRVIPESYFKNGFPQEIAKKDQ
jgi:predicted transcriptional regulator